MPEGVVDLAIIGGGVNGCAIARDAAGRGLSVVLCEERDLAGATSSASTRLVHGGLRYLEQYHFLLVHEALAEREVLLRSAPHIVRPLRFVLPHHSGLRPWPIIRMGLFIYDHLGGGRTLPGTRSVRLGSDEAGVPLKPVFRRAFEYSDCLADDSRLVVLNARDAADRGADVKTRTRCIAARREEGVWRLTLQDTGAPTRYETVHARALVNAAGPWVADVVSGVAGVNTPTQVRLVKGSHIVVDRLYDHDRAYLFQNADGRICFAIPFERDYTLIGTTDEDYSGDPAAAAIDEDEIVYLLGAVAEYFKAPPTRDSIRWTYAGVRPLYDDGSKSASAATREYLLELDAPAGQPPLLSVFGGKITTHRSLAEHAMRKLKPTFPGMKAAWTRTATLVGGDVPGGYAAWEAEMIRRFPFLDAAFMARICGAYGTRVEALLAGVTRSADLGQDFGAGLSEREVEYLVANEWAETADDILWRRSKLGLRIDDAGRAALAAFVARAVATASAA